MLEIRKKGNKNFWHYWNNNEYSASDLVISFNVNNVKFNKINGAPIFVMDGFNVSEISVYDDTDSGTEETFNNAIELEQRLIDLGYNAFYEDGEIDLSIYALKTNVLQLNNTSEFTPDEDYEPATKKYVDDNAGEENTINSITTGEPTGSEQVINVVSLTQAEYDAGTPIATTFYIITDA